MRSLIRARSAILILAVSSLLALILCGYSAGFLSVCADEFAKTVTAGEGLAHPSVWFKSVWMPLHFALIASAGVLTNDLFLGSRLVSIAFGILLVVALCGIGHHFGGNKGALLAAILGATHPLVVLLSGTAMVDICYVATYMLGVRFYLKATTSDCPSSPVYLLACGLLSLACAFHYNAWIAVILLAPFLFRDLYRAALPRRVVVSGWVILGSVPLAWVAWNWASSGNPFGFFAKHSDYSATFWASLGWHASTTAALQALKDSILLYSPLIAIFTFAAIGTVFSRRRAQRACSFPGRFWSVSWERSCSSIQRAAGPRLSSRAIFCSRRCSCYRLHRRASSGSGQPAVARLGRSSCCSRSPPSP